MQQCVVRCLRVLAVVITEPLVSSLCLPSWNLVEDAGGLAALLSGYCASQAGLPPAGRGKRGRQLQLAYLRSALPWAVRKLQFPELPTG